MTESSGFFGDAHMSLRSLGPQCLGFGTEARDMSSGLGSLARAGPGVGC